ncbi:hypothetical protein K438DRAFT_1859312 [Mycena galopus ATCC 62051]|nr:hypothetical protein K438DRAFT_1859312 [Mycena galopus ATCC 62051]
MAPTFTPIAYSPKCTVASCTMDTPASHKPNTLSSARIIDDLGPSRVPYPEHIQRPEVELNINANSGTP